jgi:hypothetical protein
MSSAERFWREHEKRLREVQAAREARRRRIREVYREVKGWEVVGDATKELIEGFLKPVVDAWAEKQKAARHFHPPSSANITCDGS